MNRHGFRAILQGRKISEDKIEPAIALAECFEAFLAGKPAGAETALAFSKALIEEGDNT